MPLTLDDAILWREQRALQRRRMVPRQPSKKRLKLAVFAKDFKSRISQLIKEEMPADSLKAGAAWREEHIFQRVVPHPSPRSNRDLRQFSYIYIYITAQAT